jgi:hypothetical protein
MDALIADIGARAGDDPVDLILILSAKGAVYGFLVVFGH